MFERIVNVAERAGRALKSLATRVTEKIKSIRINRAGLGRFAYCAGLALLLAVLGFASHAYRERLSRQSKAESEPPRAALSVQTQPFEPTPEPTVEPVCWAWPLEGEIIAGYSPDEPVWSATLQLWQTHPALDIAGSPGEAVYACGDGTVADAWSDPLWGNVVVIEHDDGCRSTYAGLNTLQMVAVGDGVKAGQVIASVGQSAACEEKLGWHLHFELTREGSPVDFAALIGGGSGDTASE